jgi:hypothetical protein
MFVTLVATGLLTACTSSSLPPERLEAARLESARCKTDPRLAGTWSSYRTSQLGPGWMRFTFGCDCTYSSRVQLLWMRISERGIYHLEDGEIVLERPGGETTRWPVELDGERLSLEEAPGEVHAYERKGRLACGGSS